MDMVNTSVLALELAFAAWEEALQSLPEGADDGKRVDFLCRLGELRASFGMIDLAIASFAKALDIREAIIADALTRENMLGLIRSSGHLGESLAYCQIQKGDPALGLIQLERAQAVELRHMLATDALPLDGLSPEYRASLLSAYSNLRRLRHEFSRDPSLEEARRSPRN